MMKKLSTKLSLMIVAVLLSVAIAPSAMSAPTDEYCAANPDAVICKDRCLTDGECEVVEDTVARIVQYIFMGIGVLAVIMIVWSGLRMTIFQNNDTKTWGKARNILLYSVAALVVALLSILIINLTMDAAMDLQN